MTAFSFLFFIFLTTRLGVGQLPGFNLHDMSIYMVCSVQAGSASNKVHRYPGGWIFGCTDTRRSAPRSLV